MNDNPKQIAYALLRITMGVNIFAHGLVRLPKLGGVSSWMVSQFKDTFLPEWLISTWGYTLPLLEFAIGLCLIVGFYTLSASVLGAFIMIALIFGSCLVENWAWAEGQMVYALFYFFVIYYIENNSWAIDKILNKEKK